MLCNNNHYYYFSLLLSIILDLWYRGWMNAWTRSAPNVCCICNIDRWYRYSNLEGYSNLIPCAHFNRKSSFMHIAFVVSGFYRWYPGLLDCFQFIMILDNNNENMNNTHSILAKNRWIKCNPQQIARRRRRRKNDVHANTHTQNIVYIKWEMKCFPLPFFCCCHFCCHSRSRSIFCPYLVQCAPCALFEIYCSVLV